MTKYEQQEKLGQGSFGVCFKAVNMENGQNVVFKISELNKMSDR